MFARAQVAVATGSIPVPRTKSDLWLCLPAGPACHKHATSPETGVCWGLVAAINDGPEPARAALAHTAGVHAGRYRGGIGDPAGLPDIRAAVGARGGQDQRGNKPARSSYNNPRSLPVHYGFGSPGVNAPGSPGVNGSGSPGANGIGPGAGGGGLGIRSSGGCPPGGIPSVGKTGSLQKPFGAMWSLQKFVESITTI
jgi:hypothetical protein